MIQRQKKITESFVFESYSFLTKLLMFFPSMTTFLQLVVC